MRQIIFAAILILGFCFIALAQTGENPQASSNFDSYEKLAWKDESARLDGLAILLLNDKDYIGYIILQLDRNTSRNAAQKRLKKIFNYLTKRRKVDKKQIVFSIARSDKEQTHYRTALREIVVNPCENCLIIKGEKFKELDKVFQLNKK